MKKSVSLLLLLIAFLSISSFSQSRDSLLKIYNGQTIYRSGNKFIKGNEKLSYNDLRLEFSTTSTKDLYKKSKSRLSVSRIFNLTSLGVVVASIFTKTSVNGSIEFAVGTGALAAAGIYYQTQSSRFLDKAIWERNKNILFNQPY